jgi:hypothetical protein
LIHPKRAPPYKSYLIGIDDQVQMTTTQRKAGQGLLSLLPEPVEYFGFFMEFFEVVVI